MKRPAPPSAQHHTRAMIFLVAVCMALCGFVLIGQWWMTEPDGSVDGKASVIF